MARHIPFAERGVCIDCGARFRSHVAVFRCEPCRNAILEVQILACRAVKRAITIGLLMDPKVLGCRDCGGQARDYDHRDYRRPLDVDPVCRTCNQRRGPAHWQGAHGVLKELLASMGRMLPRRGAGRIQRAPTQRCSVTLAGHRAPASWNELEGARDVDVS